MCDLFNPKNVTIASGVDQNKKLPSFRPIGQKMLILHENLEFLMAPIIDSKVKTIKNKDIPNKNIPKKNIQK